MEEKPFTPRKSIIEKLKEAGLPAIEALPDEGISDELPPRIPTKDDVDYKELAKKMDKPDKKS